MLSLLRTRTSKDYYVIQEDRLVPETAFLNWGSARETLEKIIDLSEWLFSPFSQGWYIAPLRMYEFIQLIQWMPWGLILLEPNLG